MKKILQAFASIILMFFSLTLLNNSALAQTQTEEELAKENQDPVIENSLGLSSEFKQFTQDPGSKKIKFQMILKSNIDSDRVAISWDVVGSSRLVEGYKDRQNIVVENGKSYAITIEVQPLGKGITEVFGKAQAFGIDGTSVTTVRKNFATNSEGEMLPLSQEYQSSKLTSTALQLGLLALGILVIVVGGLIGFKKFLSWYKRDDRI